MRWRSLRWSSDALFDGLEMVCFAAATRFPMLLVWRRFPSERKRLTDTWCCGKRSVSTSAKVSQYICNGQSVHPQRLDSVSTTANYSLVGSQEYFFLRNSISLGCLLLITAAWNLDFDPLHEVDLIEYRLLFNFDEIGGQTLLNRLSLKLVCIWLAVILSI